MCHWTHVFSQLKVKMVFIWRSFIISNQQFILASFFTIKVRKAVKRNWWHWHWPLLESLGGNVAHFCALFFPKTVFFSRLYRDPSLQEEMVPSCDKAPLDSLLTCPHTQWDSCSKRTRVARLVSAMFHQTSKHGLTAGDGHAHHHGGTWKAFVMLNSWHDGSKWSVSHCKIY